MNDIYAKRLARCEMFFQAMRALPVLHQATAVTREPLNWAFLREEFMRVNGYRQMPLLMTHVSRQTHQHSHWNHLISNTSWAESARAYAVRSQTPLTQRYAAVGRLEAALPPTRVAVAAQNIFLEHMSRVEGICSFESNENL